MSENEDAFDHQPHNELMTNTASPEANFRLVVSYTVP